MNLGIIRCMQAEAYCPESLDFRTIRERKGAFPRPDAAGTKTQYEMSLTYTKNPDFFISLGSAFLVLAFSIKNVLNFIIILLT